MEKVEELTDLVSTLTDRELEILEHLYNVESRIDIANKLDISENTLKSHLAHIYKKLEINDRVYYPEVRALSMCKEKLQSKRFIEFVYTAPLSPREYEVLSLIAEGYCNEGIVNRLGISLYTVKTHVSNIYSKLNISDSLNKRVIAMRMYDYIIKPMKQPAQIYAK